MAKKIKLPLEMANGVTVRTIEELKENWDLEKIVFYYNNGRLLTWLNDRYYSEQAEQLKMLQTVTDSQEMQKQLCSIFEMPFSENVSVNVDAVTVKNEKLDKLRKLTSDDDILKNVDKVAFDQEELVDLLDAGETVVYLVDNTFTIPLNVKNKTYIGVGSVTVVINSEEAVDFEKLGIVLRQVKFDDKYNEITNKPEKLVALGKECYVRQNYIDAMKYFMLAAEQGNANAQYELGKFYHNGYGVEKNYNEAFKWYQKAAEQGNVDAQCNMGSMYFIGIGVVQDFEKALQWYHKAAEQGNTVAQNIIKLMENDGKTNSFIMRTAIKMGMKMAHMLMKK